MILPACGKQSEEIRDAIARSAIFEGTLDDNGDEGCGLVAIEQACGRSRNRSRPSSGIAGQEDPTSAWIENILFTAANTEKHHP